MNMKQIVWQTNPVQELLFFRDGNLVPDESLVFLIKFIPFTEIRGTASTLFDMQ